MPANMEAAVEGVNDACNRTAEVAGVYGHLSPTTLTSELWVAPSAGIVQWCLPPLRQQTGKVASAMLGRNKGSTSGRPKSNISEMASARRTAHCSAGECSAAWPRPL